MSDRDDAARPKRVRKRGLLRRKTPPVRVNVAGLSHVGRVRSNNEDHFFIARYGRSFRNLQTNLPDAEVPPSIEEGGTGMVVADGIGGGPAGERASFLAIRILHQLVMQTPDWLFLLNDARVDEVLRRMRKRGAEVDAALAEMAKSDPELRGFGTTMTSAFNNGDDLFVASIGDSRAYLMRQGKLRQLTRDHTVAQELADRNFIDATELKTQGSRYRNFIDPIELKTQRYRYSLTRALGLHEGAAEKDVQNIKLENGDRLLLCTDGLTDMVEDEEIEVILRGANTAGRACRYLVDHALSSGGEDNVTAVVAFYQVDSSSTARPGEGGSAT